MNRGQEQEKVQPQGVEDEATDSHADEEGHTEPQYDQDAERTDDKEKSIEQ